MKRFWILIPLALAACTPPVKENEEDSEIWREAADKLMQIGNYEKAYQNYTRALTTWAENPWARIGIAEASREFGHMRFARGFHWMRSIDPTNPDDRANAERLAIPEFKGGQQLYEQSASMYEELIKTPPNNRIYYQAIWGYGKLNFDLLTSNNSPLLMMPRETPQQQAMARKKVRSHRDKAIDYFRRFIDQAPSGGVQATFKLLATLLIMRGSKKDLNEAEPLLKTYEDLQKRARETALRIDAKREREEALRMVDRELAAVKEARALIRERRMKPPR